MAHAREIVARVREHGANIVMEHGEMRIVNGRKLPVAAIQYIRQHKDILRDYLDEDRKAAIDERAALIEIEAGAPREWAETYARLLYRTRPRICGEENWAEFLNLCARMLDAAPFERSRRDA